MQDLHQHHDHGPWAVRTARRLGHQLEHLVRPHSHDAADKVDSAMESSREGLRTLWISLAILAVTAVGQAAVVVWSAASADTAMRRI